MGKHFGKNILPTVLKLRQEGYLLDEIARELGFEYLQIKRLICRYNRKQRLSEPVPKRRGRPPTQAPETKQVMQRRIEQLECEVELLRSFLQAAGRR